MEIKVFFYGIMADITGSRCKHYRNVTSMNDLKHRLEDDFPEMTHFSCRLTAVNDIRKRVKVLSDGDEMACLPDYAYRKE